MHVCVYTDIFSGRAFMTVFKSRTHTHNSYAHRYIHTYIYVGVYICMDVCLCIYIYVRVCILLLNALPYLMFCRQEIFDKC